MQLSSNFARGLVLCAVVSTTPAAALAVQRAAPEERTFRSEVSSYLASYGATYQRLQTEWIDARWDAARASDPATTRARRIATELALLRFTGSIENIELARAYQKRGKELPAVERRELARIAFQAAEAPAFVADLVEMRVAGDVDARDRLATHAYEFEGQRVALLDLVRVLRGSEDLSRRRAAWESHQSVGPRLRPLCERQRWLRNECVRAMGERDWFDHRVEESGADAATVLRLADEIVRDLRPLQTELHTWLRHELARRYAQPVPDLIPAHWLSDPFGRDASGVLDERPPLAAAGVEEERTRDPRVLVGAADAYFTSLGFRPMPTSSWNLSAFVGVPSGARVLDPLDPDAWHVDLDREVRWNLALEPGIVGYAEALRTLGRSHADLSTANADVPVVLRRGSGVLRNALGDLAAWNGTRAGALRAAGLTAPSGDPRVPENLRALLAEALDTVAFVPFGAGTVLVFEKELYRDELPPDRWNTRWWQLVARYQGIAPPSARDERTCDPLALPQIVVEPATYVQRAFGRVLAYQLNDHVARKMLDADPRTAEPGGRRDVGDFLRSLLRFGGSVDWRAKVRERVGSDLSARALIDYFEPLRAWLAEENRGRRATLPPL